MYSVYQLLCETCGRDGLDSPHVKMGAQKSQRERERPNLAPQGALKDRQGSSAPGARKEEGAFLQHPQEGPDPLGGRPGGAARLTGRLTGDVTAFLGHFGFSCAQEETPYLAKAQWPHHYLAQWTSGSRLRKRADWSPSLPHFFFLYLLFLFHRFHFLGPRPLGLSPPLTLCLGTAEAPPPAPPEAVQEPLWEAGGSAADKEAAELAGTWIAFLPAWPRGWRTKRMVLRLFPPGPVGAQRLWDPTEESCPGRRVARPGSKSGKAAPGGLEVSGGLEPKWGF